MAIKSYFSALTRQYNNDRHAAVKYWKEEKAKERITVPVCGSILFDVLQLCSNANTVLQDIFFKL